MSHDRIIVIEPNGVKRTKPITARGLTIGRGDENDLVVAYASASRKHAQVTYDRGHYYVTDLNSANGTHLANDRLEPNTPTMWRPGQPLRIGDVSIHLEQTITADAKSETFAGWLPEEAQRQKGRGKGRGAVFWILIVLVLIILLVALGAAAYYFLL